jgi:hypothetical protein
MTADTFREILRRAPFEPFRVVMSSGESCNVMHPEMAFVTAKALVLAIADPSHADGERLAFCSYLHIAHVETLKPSRAAWRFGICRAGGAAALNQARGVQV